jgi:hypothetical protein
MSQKRIEIFEKASNSLKISIECNAFLKKGLEFSKMSLAAIAALPQWSARHCPPEKYS